MCLHRCCTAWDAKWRMRWHSQQHGLERYNCADSLDRTNAASYFGAVQVHPAMPHLKVAVQHTVSCGQLYDCSRQTLWRLNVRLGGSRSAFDCSCSDENQTCSATCVCLHLQHGLFSLLACIKILLLLSQSNFYTNLHMTFCLTQSMPTMKYSIQSSGKMTAFVQQTINPHATFHLITDVKPW